MSAKQSIREMRESIQRQKDALRDEVRKVFYSEAKAVFEQHPGLIGFRWTQYTPYFNDGDECVFRANTGYPHLRFDGDDPKGADDDGGYSEFYNYDKKADARSLAGDCVKDFLGAFDEEDYRHLFGDHKEITVTREGISVDDYSHD